MLGRYLLCIIGLFLATTIGSIAQEDTFPDTVEDFGRTLLEVEIPMDDSNFILARHLAVTPDLSRFYVGAGGAGIVLILDEKGNPIGQLDIAYDAPINDMVVGADGNIYVLQFGNFYAFTPDGTLITELAGDFFNGIRFDRLVAMPDKSFYLLDNFSDKDRLYHLTATGETLYESEQGFFGSITGDANSQFDELRLGRDGFLYYFGDESKQMVQLDEDLDVVNVYTELITTNTGTQRSAILIDHDGRVLFGDTGVVEIYGDKETLLYTIEMKTAPFEFVQDMQFSDAGELVVLQNNVLTVLVYETPIDD